MPDEINIYVDDSTPDVVVQVSTTGQKGDPGAAGAGVPSGGTANQILEKIDGTDYNTQWTDKQDISGKADKSNVLELDNIDAFTPDADYEPATKKYVDDNAGGGTEYQIYEIIGWIDSSNTSNWMCMNFQFTPEFAQDISIAKTDDLLSIANTWYNIGNPIGIARGSQTVIELQLWGNIGYNSWDYVAIYKGNGDSGASFTSWAEVYRANISLTQKEPTVITTGFTTTSISDGDVLFAYVGASSTSNIYPISIRVKAEIL